LKHAGARHPERVFLSHAFDDRGVVDDIGGRLRAYGHETLLGYSHIPVGADLRTTLVGLVCNCTFFVLCASPASLANNWVRFECATASTRDDLRRAIVIVERCGQIESVWADWTRRVYYDFSDRSRGAAALDQLIRTIEATPAVPNTGVDRPTWCERWRQSGLDSESEAWTVYVSRKTHIRDADELTRLLEFFVRACPRGDGCERALQFLEFYPFEFLERYMSWHEFARRERGLTAIDTDPHDFAFQMTPINPTPVQMHYRKLRQGGRCGTGTAWALALARCCGAAELPASRSRKLR
jgi:hypothetical protein